MPREQALWAGVDVGGPKKGFHVALIDHQGLVAAAAFAGEDAPAAAVGWLAAPARRPALVGVDCPAAPAPDGERSRPDERAFIAARICGIRVTPDRATVYGPRPQGDDFYGWIKHGLALYGALAAAGLVAVEVFPTATWTRLAGPKGKRGRGAWSDAALRGTGLAGLPPRVSQDERDAIGAALTARAHAWGRTDVFGSIVVPALSALPDSA